MIGRFAIVAIPEDLDHTIEIAKQSDMDYIGYDRLGLFDLISIGVSDLSTEAYAVTVEGDESQWSELVKQHTDFMTAIF